MGPMPQGRGGGRRALDAVVNLVPFIDLLSCCIAFLLITAVWSQLGHLPAHLPGGAGGDDPRPPSALLTLDVEREGFRLSTSAGGAEVIPLRGGELDYVGLGARLVAWRERGTAGLAVRCADDVSYHRMMATIDAALPTFPDVSVSVD